MYDWAHGISDAIEGITHSLCTLEFEDHRPLYDWCLDNIPIGCHPQQIEFARGNLDYTVMSKRKLLSLVKEGRVSGWDDPRMPTLCGMRRRGFTAEAAFSMGVIFAPHFSSKPGCWKAISWKRRSASTPRAWCATRASPSTTWRCGYRA